METPSSLLTICKRYESKRGLLFDEDGKPVDCPLADAIAKANGMQYAEHLVKAFDGKTFGVNEENVIIAEFNNSEHISQEITETERAIRVAGAKSVTTITPNTGKDLGDIASDIFGQSIDDTITSKLDSMAQFAAVEEAEIDKLESQISTRKTNLDKLKEDMASMMIQAGMESVKLACGLSPKAVVKTKYFKAEGIDDAAEFDWLRSNGLGDIIKPYVHFQTLQSTLKTFAEQGNEVPEEIFKPSEQKTITMYGKSKFLAARNS